MQWKPGMFAVWSRRWEHPRDEQPTIALWRHPSAPFTADLADLEDETLQRTARDYLQQALACTQVQPRLQLPDAWARALLSPGSDGRFAWMPVSWPPKGGRFESYSSFRVERNAGPSSVVLLAGERLGDFIGSGFGLRIVMHVDKQHKGWQACIGELSAALPFGRYRDAGWSSGATSQAIPTLAGLLGDANKRGIARMLALQPESIAIRGVRLARGDGERWHVEWRGTGSSSSASARPAAYSFAVAGTDEQPLVPLARQAVFAGAAAGCWRLATLVPDDARLSRLAQAASAKLSAGWSGRFEVVDGSKPGAGTGAAQSSAKGAPQRIIGPDGRPDDKTALVTYANLDQLFDRLVAYGIDIQHYFRHARLPIEARYGAGIRPGRGKDGQTINARVLPEGWRADLAGPARLDDRPRLQLQLALADLSHRERKPWNRKERSPARPLGIAADPRWLWHELGHVLLMAALGELEFRFAHSAGDALAAVASDPGVPLTGNARARGFTFPHVFTPRCHDRCVSLGWSWGGSMHKALLDAAGTSEPRRKGYWSEQILSSSLFRLYRCLGGDTGWGSSSDAGEPMRESASHYCLYLIMRAIELLGHAFIVPAEQPDQFVSALISADLGAGDWKIAIAPPMKGEPARRYARVGGCAHKVIRWAFEAQGLYARGGEIADRPGEAPPVDIFIADRRPALERARGGDVAHRPGGYVPASLAWPANQRGSALADAPAWQAHEDAVLVRDGEVFVEVGNRGSETARAVRVQVWWRAWPHGDAPAWDGGAGWTRCDAAAVSVADIAAGAPALFGPFAYGPPPGRHLLFVQASCDDDLANADPAGGLPCSRLPTALVDLVANDNNLALRVVGDP